MLDELQQKYDALEKARLALIKKSAAWNPSS